MCFPWCFLIGKRNNCSLLAQFSTSVFLGIGSLKKFPFIYTVFLKWASCSFAHVLQMPVSGKMASRAPEKKLVSAEHIIENYMGSEVLRGWTGELGVVSRDLCLIRAPVRVFQPPHSPGLTLDVDKWSCVFTSSPQCPLPPGCCRVPALQRLPGEFRRTHFAFQVSLKPAWMSRISESFLWGAG